MKILISNYTFNKTLKQITFTDYTSIDLESVLIITNVTDNIIIYNFACAGFGGTVSSNVLTLDYDTSSMSDSDDLQIFYDDPEETSATDEMIGQLKLIRKLLESQATVDRENRQRVTVDAVSGVISTLGTYVGVGPNTPTIGAPINIAAAPYWQPVWTGPVDQRYQIMDNARLVYDAGIRNHLVFT